MTKTDVKLAWGKVADELSGLGLKLKYHLQEELSDVDDDADDASAEDGERDELKAALKRLADAIEDTVDAAEDAAKDPAVREDLKTTGRLLVDALSTTVNEAVNACRAASKPAAPPEPDSDAAAGEG